MPSTIPARFTKPRANVIETHEHAGGLKGDFVTRLGKRHARA